MQAIRENNYSNMRMSSSAHHHLHKYNVPQICVGNAGARVQCSLKMRKQFSPLN